MGSLRLHEGVRRESSLGDKPAPPQPERWQRHSARGHGRCRRPCVWVWRGPAPGGRGPTSHCRDGHPGEPLASPQPRTPCLYAAGVLLGWSLAEARGAMVVARQPGLAEERPGTRRGNWRREELAARRATLSGHTERSSLRLSSHNAQKRSERPQDRSALSGTASCCVAGEARGRAQDSPMSPPCWFRSLTRSCRAAGASGALLGRFQGLRGGVLPREG